MLSSYMEPGSFHLVCEFTIRCASFLFVHHDFLFSLMPVTGRIVSNGQQKVQRLHSYTRTDGPAYGRLEVSLWRDFLGWCVSAKRTWKVA